MAITGLNLAQNHSKQRSDNLMPDMGSVNKKQLSFGAQIPVREGYFKDFSNSVCIKHMDKVLNFATSIPSVLAFFFGGAALVYDSMVKKARKKNTKDDNLAQLAAKTVMRDSDSSSDKLKGTVEFNGKTAKDDKKKSADDFGHFQPETKIGKAGLLAAQSALVVSGFAGFSGGLALAVPLMAAGEFIGNVIAAPIINTPTGYGLMNIGLAALFAGRAFDTNPTLKANYSVLATQKGLWNKSKYIMANMGACLNEAVKATGLILKETVNLANVFSKTRRQESMDFFKYYILRTRSSSVRFVQKIDAKGVTQVGRELKGYPYHVLAASLILAAGGVLVIATEALQKMGILKTNKAKKASFRVAEGGQVLDNASLISYGLQRCYMGNPAAGVPTMISGATMMVGAPNADNDFGKGLTWFGLSFFFMFFIAERFDELRKILKGRASIKASPKKMMEEAAFVARQFDIDFARVIPKTHLGHFSNLLDKHENSVVQFMEMIADMRGKESKYVASYKEKLARQKSEALEAFKNHPDEKVRRIPEFLDFIQQKLGGKYVEENDVKWLQDEIGKAGFPQEFTQVVTTKGNEYEIIKSAHYENAKIAGSLYKETLERDANNPELSDAARKAAADSLRDYANLLAKN